MTTQMVYELNHTYMVVCGGEVENTDNYRYKMLSANNIKGILPLEIRMINGEKRIYIDITGKESLLYYFTKKNIDRHEIKGLFEAIYLISGQMTKYLIGETDVILRPEMVFKNIQTGEFEFVCIPLIEEGIPINEGMKSLMQFILMHLDNEDEKLVRAIYSISEMFENGYTKFSLAYEYFTEEMKEEEYTVTEEEVEEEKTFKFSMYYPSLKEIAAFAMLLVGLLIIGVNLYLSMRV